MGYKIFRNTCPRNCYGTCAVLSHVQNGRLVKVTGDPQHGFTQGKLCAKGYASTQFVYHSQRLKYPMMQVNRGSGKWKRISWEEAYSIIADKMVELNTRYGSNLASGYNKCSGNIGILHYATEGMFNSIGPHTKPVGNPCALSGQLAMNKSFGQNFSSVPEDIANTNLIVIWGANPAVTNIHQMKFIYEARKKGAILVVIDPIFTETAKKADIYIQIKPRTDAWLALAIAKMVVDSGDYAKDFLENQTSGWEVYKKFLNEQVTLDDVYSKTGVPVDAINELANLYKTKKPAVTWNGLGIQRTDQGGHSISAINSLAAITGNLNTPFGGLYYMHFDVENFPLHLVNHSGPRHPNINASREIDICNFPETANSIDNPPLKLLWIASRNIFAQDQNLKAWDKLLKELELVVVVDLYMTKTAEQADIVLPAATHFEEDDLNVGYWHYWISINQKAIPPYFEAKSDLQIARELTRKLNELSPGFSNFPSEKEPLEWITDELTPKICKLYAITGYEDLLNGPHKKIDQPSYSGDSHKFQLFSPKGIILNEWDKQETNNDPSENIFRLISPQSLLKIHSQYETLPWLNRIQEDSFIHISSDTAEIFKLQENDKIEIFNDQGVILGIAKIDPTLPNNIIVTNQGGDNPINKLIVHKSEDSSSTFFYDCMVRIRKWSDNNV